MDQTSEVAQAMNQTSDVAKETDPTSKDLGSIPHMNVTRQDVPSTSYPVIEPGPQPQSPPRPQSDPQSSSLADPETQPYSDPQSPSLSAPEAQQQNLPCGDLVVGSRQEYIPIGVPLYQASITGDWKAAKTILDKRPELVRYAVTENYDTALHLAASAEDTKLMEHFVQNLVNVMCKEDLELRNMNHNTALSLAAAAGSVKLAQIMVEKNSALLGIPGGGGSMPLYAAALYGKHDMVKYLYNVSQGMNGNFWTDQNRRWVVLKCVEADIFDVPQIIMKDHPELTENLEIHRGVLKVLAGKPDAFTRREGNVIWRIIGSIFPIIRQKLGPAGKDGDALKLLRFILGLTNIMGKEDIMPTIVFDKYLWEPTSSSEDHPRLLFIAAEMGNARFIVELIRCYPDLIWKTNNAGHTIFHIAVMHRHQGIFNLLYEIGSMTNLITSIRDNDENNMLHLVGMTSKQMRPQMSGASLIMQRELLWYKGVEKMMPPFYRERKNKAGEKPYELFSENNKDLVSQGLKWMKDCMVVATLIVTIAFAVAFTVPGGYNQNNGFPMFVHDRAFLVFVIADAISLVCSSASLLVFLSILTSRHNERDFMSSLPTKLMIGLASLFISVTAMMVTFSVSFFVLYHNGLKWVPILISVFATGPIILFAILQAPMLEDMLRSMYDDRYIFKPKKRMLYNVNPRF